MLYKKIFQWGKMSLHCNSSPDLSPGTPQTTLHSSWDFIVDQINKINVSNYPCCSKSLHILLLFSALVLATVLFWLCWDPSSGLQCSSPTIELDERALLYFSPAWWSVLVMYLYTDTQSVLTHQPLLTDSALWLPLLLTLKCLPKWHQCGKVSQLESIKEF